jgi:hypothetical protein
MRICTDCKESKTLDLFHKNSQTKDGISLHCKVCANKRGRKYYLTAGKKKYVQRSADLNKKYNITKRLKYPEKVAAANALSRIMPVTDGNHLHHWSYNEIHYKDVIELPRSEHDKIHRYMIYDNDKKMYRRRDTMELLWSRNIHIKFYRTLKDKP